MNGPVNFGLRHSAGKLMMLEPSGLSADMAVLFMMGKDDDMLIGILRK